MKFYLDNAATTPMDPEVVNAMIPVMQNQFGNPSSIHTWGREVKTAIENARKNVAKQLNVAPAEIFIVFSLIISLISKIIFSAKFCAVVCD